MEIIKNILKFMLPRKLLQILKLMINYIYDYKRYKKYSGTYSIKKNRYTLEGMIIHTYHALEKGLSLKNPRKGFGKDKAEHLLELIQYYVERFGVDETIETSLNTLDAYYKYQLEQGVNYNQIKVEIDKVREKITTSFTEEGGYKIVSRDEILQEAQINFKDFAFSRYSIRTYEPLEVENSIIKEAVYIAQKTPSVCNRQTSKVYVFSDDELKNKVLSYQNGNKGFGDSASKILLVTSDLSLFHGTYERNQAFIDGGLFSMSLLYSLHSFGLGACALNCSTDYNIDKGLRKVAGIGESEAIIMMISVGWIPEKVKVAQSHRRSTDEIVSFK